MKLLNVVVLGALLALASAARRRPVMEALDSVCGNLPMRTCGPRMRACTSTILRVSNDTSSNRDVVRACAQESGARDTIADALAQEGPVDRPSLAEGIKDDVRLCILKAEGLADDTGAVNGELFLSQVEENLTANLQDQPELRDVLLDAAASCPVPSRVEDVVEFRKCMGRACVQNYPEN